MNTINGFARFGDLRRRVTATSLTGRDRFRTGRHGSTDDDWTDMSPRPAAYGYLCLGDDEEGENDLRQRLMELAATEGLTIIGVYVDHEGHRPDGYTALVEALRAYGV